MSAVDCTPEAAAAAFPGVLAYAASPSRSSTEAPLPSGGDGASSTAPSAPAQYTIIKRLGSGATGTAFRVRAPGSTTDVVAKITDMSNMTAKKQQYARNEMQCLALCDHFSIIKHHAHQQSDDGSKLLIIMERADASDLSNQIKRRAADKTFFQEHEVAFLFLQMVLAVDYIHRNKMLHRDIKSANVFLMTCGVTKLGDFGFSQRYQDTVSELVAGTFCGTPYYLAPELWRRQRYSKKADVWSLGVLLYELAALKRPFTSSTMIGVMDKVIGGDYEPLPAQYSDNIRNMVRWILHFDPNQRPDTRQILDTPFMKNVISQFETVVRTSPTITDADKAAIQHELDYVRRRAPPVYLPPGAQLSVSKKGEVYKYSGGTWQRRYLCLAGDILTVSTVDVQRPETKQQPLDEVAIVGEVRVQGMRFVFRLRLRNGNSILFRAATEEELREWIEHLSDAAEVAAASSPAIVSSPVANGHPDFGEAASPPAAAAPEPPAAAS